FSYIAALFSCAGGQHYTVYSGWTYHDNFGVSHYFSGFTQQSGGPLCPPSVPTLTATALDGSGYTLNVTNITTAVAYSKEGTKNCGPLLSWSGAGLSTGPHGNQITLNSNSQFFYTVSSTVPALTIAGSGTPSSPVTFTYSAPSGSANYTAHYTNYTVATNFG